MVVQRSKFIYLELTREVDSIAFMIFYIIRPFYFRLLLVIARLPWLTTAELDTLLKHQLINYTS